MKIAPGRHIRAMEVAPGRHSRASPGRTRHGARLPSLGRLALPSAATFRGGTAHQAGSARSGDRPTGLTGVLPLALIAARRRVPRSRTRSSSPRARS